MVIFEARSTGRMLDEAAVAALATSTRGELIRPGDAGYDVARKVNNGMIDRYPALVVRATNVADVIASVNFAREQGLLLAIRGGGHNGPGLGTCDDGLVLDLGLMKGVRVDPAASTARVRQVELSNAQGKHVGRTRIPAQKEAAIHRDLLAGRSRHSTIKADSDGSKTRSGSTSSWPTGLL